jgi:hypothetical protein
MLPNFLSLCDLTLQLFQKKMSTSFTITGASDRNHRDEDATGSALPQTNLFLPSRTRAIQVNEDSSVVLSTQEKRLEKKRQRHISVSKSYYFVSTKVLNLSTEH